MAVHDSAIPAYQLRQLVGCHTYIRRFNLESGARLLIHRNWRRLSADFIAWPTSVTQSIAVVPIFIAAPRLSDYSRVIGWTISSCDVEDLAFHPYELAHGFGNLSA
jgi:hypothetical protein